jgi:hypothetical protein
MELVDSFDRDACLDSIFSYPVRQVDLSYEITRVNYLRLVDGGKYVP